MELFAGRGEQKIALVAVGVGRANQRPRSIGERTRRDIVPGRKRRSAKFARSRKQIAEFDRAVALDARHRGLAKGVTFGEIVDYRFTEAVLIVQHIMRDADLLGDKARVMDVLPGTAGAFAMGGRAVIVKLQCDADDVVAFRLQKRGRYRRIDAARHGDDNPCILRMAFKVQTVAHGSGH